MRRFTVAIATAVLAVALPFAVRGTGVPVFDASNLLQNTTTALKTVAMAAKQVEQYNLQLQQYANEIKQATGLADVARVYQQYQQTQQQLAQLYAQFGNSGNLQNYLNQFQNVAYWQQVPPQNYAQAANSSWNQNSQTQKQQNDAWAQALAQHQQLLQSDAARMEAAQRSAAGAGTELAAIQASSQLNAAVLNQLLQIHALLVQEQQALQTRQASGANDEAMRKAANQKFEGWTYKEGSGRTWQP
jgi:P-type conjugative transfer protein TrbJ